MKRLVPVLAGLFLATPVLAQDHMTVILDWFVNLDHGPIIIAQEQGYFADEGLEVEIVPPADEESWEIFSGTAPELQDELDERARADTIARFALSPAALDPGRYAAFEQFLADAELIEGTVSVSELAADVGMQ